MSEDFQSTPGGSAPLPGERAGAWVREHAALVLFAALLLIVLPMRDLWAPDEPDFAQCVKEMQLRGTWLMPWLNGLPYDEKPILYYWVMKGSNGAMNVLTGGLGFSHGLAAWALRLPSVVASLAFLHAYQKWAKRFLQAGVARLALMILATSPLWFWQSQFIQIDLLFSVLLAWAWFSWLGGYLLELGLQSELRPGEAGRWFHKAYFWLALAFLAKGPLAGVLSILVLGAFLLWQRDARIILRMRLGTGVLLFLAVVLPWYVAAGIQGGGHYVYQLLIHQNFERATKAWDHIQPWWRYLEYLLGDFFPWVLLLPALGFFLRGSGATRNVTARFLMVAFAVPFLFLSWVQSKQGKYLLPSYPFLALLMAGMLQPLSVEGVSPARIRRLGGVLAVGVGLLGLVLLAVTFGAGGAAVQAQVAPYRALAGTLGALATLGGLSLAGRALSGGGQHLVRETALTLGLIYLLGGTWGFRKLDPQKNFFEWSRMVQPMIQGRKVVYWQTIRSGAMVYTDSLMPEIRTAGELDQLGPEDRLVSMRREWDQDMGGLTPELRNGFEVLLSRPTGGGELLLLKRKAR